MNTIKKALENSHFVMPRIYPNVMTLTKPTFEQKIFICLLIGLEDYQFEKDLTNIFSIWHYARALDMTYSGVERMLKSLDYNDILNSNLVDEKKGLVSYVFTNRFAEYLKDTCAEKTIRGEGDAEA
jgi:hypothetical protein